MRLDLSDLAQEYPLQGTVSFLLCFLRKKGQSINPNKLENDKFAVNYHKIIFISNSFTVIFINKFINNSLYDRLDRKKARR